jgi:hypothetical protein
MTAILDIPGTNRPTRFSAPIKAFLGSTDYCSLASETARDLVEKVTTSSDPAEALWELWDAFFNAVVYSTIPHDPYLVLLDAIRAQPPSHPDNIPEESDAKLRLRSHTQQDGRLHWSELPLFSAQWRDVHDILQQWRDWDGIRDARGGDESTASRLSYSGSDLYFRFCAFSTAILKSTGGKSFVHAIWVFYLCHEILERKSPQPGQPKSHRMLPEQLWAFDIRIAAMWLREGGQALWEADHDELREHWAAALDCETELWSREDGLTNERWQLWEERLWNLSKDEQNLDEETRTAAAEASKVTKGLLSKRDI